MDWPVGQAANGSSGVAAAIKQTDGAIGYASQDYAVTSGLSSAAVQGAGWFLRRSDDGRHQQGGRRAAVPDHRDDEHPELLDSGRLPDRIDDVRARLHGAEEPATAQTLVDFWHWGLTKGQAVLTR